MRWAPGDPDPLSAQQLACRVRNVLNSRIRRGVLQGIAPFSESCSTLAAGTTLAQPRPSGAAQLKGGEKRTKRQSSADIELDMDADAGQQSNADKEPSASASTLPRDHTLPFRSQEHADASVEWWSDMPTPRYKLHELSSSSRAARSSQFKQFKEELVLGKWLEDPHFYPGRVLSVSKTQGFHVLFDDGSKQWTSEVITPQRFAPGQDVSH